jgi:hypothetical protein
MSLPYSIIWKLEGVLSKNLSSFSPDSSMAFSSSLFGSVGDGQGQVRV